MVPRCTKSYDTARTLYQRLLDASVPTEAKRQELAATYHGLNPITLLKQINENLEHLWNLAEWTSPFTYEFSRDFEMTE